MNWDIFWDAEYRELEEIRKMAKRNWAMVPRRTITTESHINRLQKLGRDTKEYTTLKRIRREMRNAK